MSAAAERFAEALYSLCREAGNCDEALDDTQKLSIAFRDEPDFQRILASPDISKHEKCALLDSCFKGQAQEYVLSALKLMCEKGRIRDFEEVCALFKQLYNEDHNILTVKVTSAQPLSEGQSERLLEKLKALSGRTVKADFKVDKTCLGGVRLEYEGKRVDDTLQHRLQDIAKQIENTRV